MIYFFKPFNPVFSKLATHRRTIKNSGMSINAGFKQVFFRPRSLSERRLVHFPHDQPAEAKWANKYEGDRSNLKTAHSEYEPPIHTIHVSTLQSEVMHPLTYKPLLTVLSNYIAEAARRGKFKEVCLSHP